MSIETGHFRCNIGCFFSDKYQIKLRKKSLEKVKHINQLIDYRNSIVDIFDKDFVLSCSTDEQIEIDREYSEQISKIVRNRKIELIQFLNDIIESYSDYISGSHINAYQKIEKILNNIDIKNQRHDHNKSNKIIFFRSRKNKEDNDFRKEEFYHIPFTKLNKVENNRYSSTGHPFLYLGRSLINIEKELNIDSFENYSFSCFLLKDWTSFKYFRFINTFDHRFKDLSSDATALDFEENELDTLKAIYRFLLIQFCSFPVNSKEPFHEEYVLPQLLVEYLKKHDFNGILYSSTKDYDFSKNSDFKYNLVLFTKYSGAEEEKHDHSILEKFIITEPIKYNKSKVTTIRDLTSDINTLVKQNCLNTLYDLNQYPLNMGDLLYNTKPYMESDLGQFQNYLIQNAIQKI
jgi:hypothetical protein